MKAQSQFASFKLNIILFLTAVKRLTLNEVDPSEIIYLLLAIFSFTRMPIG